MLNVRGVQIQAFADAASRRFEQEMARHLSAFAPPHAKMIGAAAVRNATSHLIEKARSHGFTQRGPIRTYLEMSWLFGGSFDVDPQYPWVDDSLRDQHGRSEMARAIALYEAASAFLDAVHGPENQHGLDALRRLGGVSHKRSASSAGDFDEDAVALLSYIHPRKFNFVPRSAMAHFIAEARDRANRQGLTSTDGQMLVVIIAFSVGIGFPDDPLLPFLAHTFARHKHDAAALEQHLVTRINIYRRSVLRNAARL